MTIDELIQFVRDEKKSQGVKWMLLDRTAQNWFAPIHHHKPTLRGLISVLSKLDCELVAFRRIKMDNLPITTDLLLAARKSLSELRLKVNLETERAATKIREAKVTGISIEKDYWEGLYKAQQKLLAVTALVNALEAP